MTAMNKEVSFEVIAIEGKGMGVRARRAYRKGEMILCEPAILVGSHSHRTALEQQYHKLTMTQQVRGRVLVE